MGFQSKYRGDSCCVCGRHDIPLLEIREGIFVCRGEHLNQEIRESLKNNTDTRRMWNV